MFKVEGKDFSKQQLAQKRTARVYKDLWKRLSQGGVRVPLGKDTLMYPSTNSKKLGVMEGRAGQTLSFKTIKTSRATRRNTSQVNLVVSSHNPRPSTTTGYGKDYRTK